MKNEFDGYIRRYSSDLTRLCISLCPCTADAEDLFQETWYKAMKSYKTYDASKPFDKWLFSICVNTYKNSLKLSYNRRKFEFKNDEEKELFINSIPDTQKSNSDIYIALHKEIMALPKKQKLVVVLHYFKGYSEKEIAEILKVPEGTVKSRMYTAKKRLKERLSHET